MFYRLVRFVYFCLSSSSCRWNWRRFLLSLTHWASSTLVAVSDFFVALWLSLSWPRLSDGTQSWLCLSERGAAFPEWKWSPQTQSFSKIFSIRSALLMAASQSRRLSSERASVLSPWFFITFGTPQKEICGHFFLSLEHPTIKQNDGISTRSASCQVSSNGNVNWCLLNAFRRQMQIRGSVQWNCSC